MAECRYKGWCRIEYDTDFDVCYPCVGDGNEACVSYEPMPDVKALLALADDLETYRLPISGAAVAEQIREALGVVE